MVVMLHSVMVVELEPGKDLVNMHLVKFRITFILYILHYQCIRVEFGMWEQVKM